jgi:putative endopeptidase
LKPAFGLAGPLVLSAVLTAPLLATQAPAQPLAARQPAAQPPAAQPPTAHPAAAEPGQPAPAATAPALPYTPVLDPSAMDRGVDPCVDFYAYSCGGWMKANPIPPDQAIWSVYGKLHDENLEFLHRVLEDAARPDPRRDKVAAEIGDFYAACMDQGAIDRAGAAPLAADEQAIAAIRSREDLAREVARLQQTSGARAPFVLASDQDFQDSTQVIAVVGQGGLGLPDRDYYFKSDPKSQEARQRYTAHVQKMFELLGEPAPAAAAAAADVMRMETALAKASLTRVERRDPANVYHKQTREQLAALAPTFAWDAYFAAAGLPPVRALNVAEPAFFQALDDLLRREQPAAWRTYLRWHLVRARAGALASPFEQESFAFNRGYLGGVQELAPRWKRCVQAVDHFLGEALGQAYVARTFSPADKQRTLKMVEEIERAMQADIEQIAWMSAATRQQALRKLHSVANKIGYPDRWRDYGAIRILPRDHAGNTARAVEFEQRRQLAKIGKPVDRGEWGMTPPTVNAYYNPQTNDINFPAGILQPPLFDPRLDDAPNYGDTGSTIGHELTHGFDDEGRKFDALGNLRDWWSAEDGKEFERRAACVSDQYSQYTIIDDIKINGKLTLGEDVADVGGAILAFNAWREATRGRQLQPIDGFSPEQRFFIGYGQQWCTNERDAQKRLRATTDAHSPARYRTNGVVANMPEFARAFACKPGQPLAPEKICRVW